MEEHKQLALVLMDALNVHVKDGFGIDLRLVGSENKNIRKRLNETREKKTKQNKQAQTNKTNKNKNKNKQNKQTNKQTQTLTSTR